MAFMDKMLNMMRLNDDEDEEDEVEEEDDLPYDDEEEKAPKKSVFSRERKHVEEEEEEEPEKERVVKATPRVTPITKGQRKQVMGMEVCVFKPTSVEDGREITETLLNGCTVVLNVEGLNVEVAQRIIDFTSGACFAIAGNLQKIANYIFIITPKNVDISGDFQNIADSFNTTRSNY